MLSSEEIVNLEECERVAIDIAKSAGKMISDTCGKVSSIESKQSFADLVTETDKNVEKFVFEQLKEKFPEHKFIGEESVAANNYAKVNLTDAPTWIVDPVDGTMNFVHTFPYVAVAIGLAVGKRSVMGVVYCPALDKLYTARQGKGAYCNGTRLQVRKSRELKDSLVCVELGSDRNEEKRNCVFKNMEAVGWRCHGLRSLGSGALNICAVASGHVNGYFEFGLHCWDMCAPAAILKEAGGYVCDTKGGEFNLLNRRLIAACNEQIAKELSQTLSVHLDLESD